MKKLFTIVCTLVLGGALTFAQTGASAGAQTPAAGDKTQTTTTTKKSSKKKGHKGKKGKKAPQTTATPAPK